MAAPPPRRPGRIDPRAAAEAAFRKPGAPPPPPADRPPAVPGAKEQVSLRIDRDILDHFQKDGPGWQERIVAALRREVTAGTAIPAADLNVSNDK